MIRLATDRASADARADSAGPTASASAAGRATDPDRITDSEGTTDPEGTTGPERIAETERMGDEIAELAAHIHAATYRLMVLLRQFDERGGWGGGFRTCAHWLSWRIGIGLGTAREKVRVARALAELPGISEAMERGQLSFSKVRALTRVATADNEAKLLELARHATTSHLERVVRAWKHADRVEEGRLERARHEARSLTLFPDDDGSWILRGRLDPEVGAVLRKALEAAADELYRQEREERAEGEADAQDPERGPDPHAPLHHQRRADAIGLVAERALAHEGEVRRADRFQVVVHVEEDGAAPRAEGAAADPDAAAGEEGTAAEEDAAAGHAVLADSGHRVSAETSRRLSCDASLVRMRHDTSGDVLDVGRRTRTVPPAIRRALEYRDRTCRFPGCGVRHTDAHHVTHWADGGETRLDNLVLLCRRHHRAVHEGEVRVEVVEGPEEVVEGQELGAEGPELGVEGPEVGAQGLRFTRPDGRAIPDAPLAPLLPPSPTDELIRTHGEIGITPDAWTATPRWYGERLDLGLAIDALRV